MNSKGVMVAAALFLACVAAFVVYLSFAPETAPPPQAEARPEPVPFAQAVAASPTPVVEAPSPPPPPAPEPLPEPQPQPEPEPSAQVLEGDHGQIKGVVTRATVPLARIKVTATPDAASGETGVVTATTDSLGRFTLAQVPPGQCVVRVADSGLAGDLSAEVLVVKGETSEVQFALPSALASVSGVVHAGDVLVPGAEIEVTISDEQLVQTLTVSSPDGRYAIDKLLPGVVGVTVTAEYVPGKRRVKTESFGLLEGEAAEKDFNFSEPSRLSGIIRGIEDDQKTMVVALNGIVQGVESLSDPQEVSDRIARLTSPDATGFYLLAGLEPATYTVVVFSMRVSPDDNQTPIYHTASHVVDLAEQAEVSLDMEIKW